MSIYIYIYIRRPHLISYSQDNPIWRIERLRQAFVGPSLWALVGPFPWPLLGYSPPSDRSERSEGGSWLRTAHKTNWTLHMTHTHLSKLKPGGGCVTFSSVPDETANQIPSCLNGRIQHLICAWIPHQRKCMNTMYDIYIDTTHNNICMNTASNICMNTPSNRHIYIYIYIYIHVCIYIYIYIHVY